MKNIFFALIIVVVTGMIACDTPKSGTTNPSDSTVNSNQTDTSSSMMQRDSIPKP